MGDIVTYFGEIIQKECRKNPLLARRMLRFGYRAKKLQAYGCSWKRYHKSRTDGGGPDHDIHDRASGASRTGGYGKPVSAL